jgi:hypothetical protein
MPSRVTVDLGATVASLHEWLMVVAQSATGAFWAWCDLATGQPSFEYPEITGYALTYLAGLATLSTRERAAGERASSWLMRRLDRGDLAAREGWDNGAVYLFDLGMIAAGLLSFGRRIRSERMVASGLGLVTLLRSTLERDPTFSPTWLCGPASERRAWSTHGRAHLAKIVQALLLGDDGRDGSVAYRLIEYVKRLQHDDGRFETGLEPKTMLHPHLYAAEGLWIWGTARADADAIERAHAAVTWAWNQQLPSGGFPHAARSAAPREQSDVTAQVIRLTRLLGVDAADVDRAVARLVELTEPTKGFGIVYEPGGANPHVNTWSSLFAAQALASAVPGAPTIPWECLV